MHVNLFYSKSSFAKKKTHFGQNCANYAFCAMWLLAGNLQFFMVF